MNVTYTAKIPEVKIRGIVEDVVEDTKECIANGTWYPETIFENYCDSISDAWIEEDYEEFWFFISHSRKFQEKTWEIFRDCMIEKLKENNIQMKVDEEKFQEYLEKGKFRYIQS